MSVLRRGAYLILGRTGRFQHFFSHSNLHGGVTSGAAWVITLVKDGLSLLQKRKSEISKKSKGFFMKCTIVLLTTFVLMVCVLFAGCTSPTDAKIKPFETTVPAPSPATTSSSTSTVVSTPISLETLPYEQNVGIHVEKQRPDATIHLIYTGGSGADNVWNIMMRVTRSDGTVEEKYLNDGTRRPRLNDELVMDGTRGIDQVAVFLTSAGKTYKIFDKPLAYP
jgi:hypothetical protein